MKQKFLFQNFLMFKYGWFTNKAATSCFKIKRGFFYRFIATTNLNNIILV